MCTKPLDRHSATNSATWSRRPQRGRSFQLRNLVSLLPGVLLLLFIANPSWGQGSSTRNESASATQSAGENLKRMNQAITAGEFKIASAYMTQQGATEVIGDLAGIAISLADSSINESFPAEFDPFKSEFKQILDGADLTTQWDALNSDPAHFEKFQSLQNDAAGIRTLDKLLNAAAAMPWNGFDFRGNAKAIFQKEQRVFVAIARADGKEFEEGGQVPVYRFVSVDGMWKFDGLSEKQTLAYQKKIADLPPQLADPSFKGKTADGENVNWSDYQGDVVLFDFWGTWCAPCVANLPKLEKIRVAFESHGFKIIGVPMDDAETLKNFYKTKPLAWKNVIDPDGDLKEQFGVKVYPTTMLIDKNGQHIASNLEEDELVDRLAELYGIDPAQFDSLKRSLHQNATPRK